MKFTSLIRVAMAMAATLTFSFAQTATSGEAFGAPGLRPTHGPSQKSFLGTAVNASAAESAVYFTGYRGIVSEVFYPTLDTVESIDLQLFIADKARTFVDEEKREAYAATRTDPRTMSWQVTTGNRAHNWQVKKVVFTDPSRHALVERVTFEALNGTNIGQYDVYLLFKPYLDNAGAGNTARTAAARDGRLMLVANRNTRYSALAASLPWKTVDGTPMLSSGFVGRSDGWTDLLGGQADKTMDWTYTSASNGNIAQMAWLEFGASTATSVSFDVVLAFDSRSADGAMSTANAVLASDLDVLRNRYDKGWHAYASGLSTQGGTADDEYYLAAMTLKSMQDKSNGAMIAGIGTPWGETQGDENAGGYHLVWPRDLFKFANALITAGDTATATAVVQYLFGTLQQKTDCGEAEYDASGCEQGYSRRGRFPQNAWVSGRQYWQGTQMDQQAMPILLAWRLGPAVFNALWPELAVTADYIVATGPWTQQERWEENSGYSPSTIAAQIAGLVVAADIALANGDRARAGQYLSTADYWQQNVAAWTYTHNGPYGNGRYYIRINPAAKRATGAGAQQYDPVASADAPQTLALKNGGGERDARAVIDGGFLELVRLGIKRADDPTILSTLAAYDAVVKQTIDGRYPAWFRYNFDGYGEHNDGGDFDGSGVGRLWPIFTAERGMYAIAASGRGRDAQAYLAALRRFATPEGFIPEQIWPNDAVLPDNWAVKTPPSYSPGAPTKSIAPLNWAMGEYISLLASMHAGRIVDIPSIVCVRYRTCAVTPPAGQVAVTLSATAGTQPGQHLYVAGDVPALGNWDTKLGLPADPADYPLWRQTVNLPAGARIQYKYYRRNADGSVSWENYADGGNRTLVTPASGSIARDDVVNW